ncbi:MAG TPA: aminotransferase class V-fold PLP-dependent enzyme [Bacteroidales bacterium]|nr:aminotransferase class V-fold PLP-dependent enzyme [Bacteroidales bacterium]
MMTRRELLKSMALGAFALPVLTSGSLANQMPVKELRKLTGIPGLPSDDDPDFWIKVRDQFLLARDKVFFNTGTLGASPRIVVSRMMEHFHHVAMNIADWDYEGDGGMMSGYFPYRNIREKIADLLRVDTDEISLTENVTQGMSYLGCGIDLMKGDEVLTSNQEHPGGQSSWLLKEKRDGVVFKIVELPKPIHNEEQVIELVVNAFTPRTKVLMLSHVITGSGAILPVKEICAEARKRGIITILDGAQAVGHIEVNLKETGCDAYTGCFHKWILAPAGNGFLYIRKDMAPKVWTTLAGGNWDNHEDEGFRFTQRGTGSLTLLIGLEAALDFHNELGHDRVISHIKGLGYYLREGLRKNPKVKIYSPDQEKMCGAITVYGIEGYNGPQLMAEMWKRDRLRPRSSMGIGLRQSTHIYNSIEEIDRSLKIVGELSGA